MSKPLTPGTRIRRHQDLSNDPKSGTVISVCDGWFTWQPDGATVSPGPVPVACIGINFSLLPVAS